MDPYQYLLSASFRLISFRPRSKKECYEALLKKAQKKDISLEILDTVMARLEELGYINDQKFADAFVLGSMGNKPRGPATIKFELKKRGVSQQIIDEVFKNNAELSDETSQLQMATKALGKKGELYKKLPVLECKRKVHDYLLRKGFSGSITRRLVDDYCGKSYNRSQETIDI